MHKAIKIGLWSLVTLLVLAAGLLLYLQNADLSVYEKRIESALSSAIGHNVDFAGRFELHFGSHTYVVAEDVHITNDNWPGDDELLSVGHLSVTFDTWSVLSSPFIVEQLDIRDVRINGVRDQAGLANWDTGRVRKEPASNEPIDVSVIAFKVVSLQNLALIYDEPARDKPLNLEVQHLSVIPDESDVLDLVLQGGINSVPLAANGSIGPWQNLIDAKNIRADLDLSLGRLALDIEGNIADVKLLDGLVFDAILTGPAIEKISDIFALPPFASGAFRLEARAEKVGDINELELSGNLGEIDITAAGFVDRFIGMDEANLDFSLAGPDIRHVAEVFGVEGIPTVPFEASGDLNLAGSRFDFARTKVDLGKNNITVDGWLDLGKKVPDGDVTITAAGPNIAAIGPFFGLQGMPRESFSVTGHVAKSGAQVRFDEVVAAIGPNRVSANGALGQDGTDDAEIFLSVGGPDISVIGPMTGLADIPQKPFSASVYLRPDPVGINLDEAKLIIGDNEAEIDGVIGTTDGLSGTNVSVHGFGPELHNVSLLTGIPYLPYGEYDYRASVGIDDGRLTIDSFDATVVGAELAVSGTLDLGNRAGDFDLGITVASDDVSQLELFDSLRELDGEALRLEGDVRHRNGIFDLSAVTVNIGNVGVAINGEFDSNDLSARLSVDANAPDAELLDRFLPGRELPDGALLLNGQIERNADNIEFTDTSFNIGAYLFAVHGTLSNSPLSNSSDLDLSVSGPNLQELGAMLGVGIFPPKTYRLAAEVNGTPSGFAIENIDAAIGENKIDGRFTANLEGKPRVTGELQATYLDLASQMAKQDSDPGPPDGRPASPYVMPDNPLPLEWLDSFDADIDFKAERLLLTRLDVHDFHVGVHIEDGAIKVDPISLGELDGKIAGYFHVSPQDDVYEIDASLQIENIHLGLVNPDGFVRSALPALNGSIDLSGTGNSAHQIMSTANGRIFLTQSSGQTSNTFVSRLFGDVVTEIINTVNPLRSQSEYTTLDCAFYIIGFEDGLATIEEIVMQTEKVTLAATGSVRFSDESLRMSVNTKPRKGFGVSVGGIANSFFNIRGTMKKPRLQVDVAGSAVTGGAAVATGGLSLVAKGLWDRMSSEKSICDQPRE